MRIVTATTIRFGSMRLGLLEVDTEEVLLPWRWSFLCIQGKRWFELLRFLRLFLVPASKLGLDASFGVEPNSNRMSPSGTQPIDRTLPCRR